jgi:hypothetical protein
MNLIIKLNSRFFSAAISLLTFGFSIESKSAIYRVDPNCGSLPRCYSGIAGAVSAAETDFINMVESNLEIHVYPNRNSQGQIIPYFLPGASVDVKVPMKIRGIEGPVRTVIDLQNQRRAFALTATQNFPTLEYLIEGLQIRNGFVNLNTVYQSLNGPMATIFCPTAGVNSIPAFYAVGGAIVVDTPETVKIRYNWFFNNEANPYQGPSQPVSASFGGAIGVNHFQNGGLVEIEDNYFEDNFAGQGNPARGGSGGAIHAFLTHPNSNLIVRRNHFNDNFASANGGAISVSATDRLRNNCDNNQNYVGHGTALIESNMIRNNRMIQDATNPLPQGAGIAGFWVQNLNIRNNIITGNTISTPNAGAAIFLHQLAGNQANIDHNTIFNNSSHPGNPLVPQGVIGSARGNGQVFLPGADGPGLIRFRNSIVRKYQNGGMAFSNSCGSQPCNTIEVTNSNIEWGSQPGTSTSHVGISLETNIINLPANFVSEGTQDLHLLPSSSGINAGALLPLVSVDSEGNPRVAANQLNPDLPDQGAHEYYPSSTTYLLENGGTPIKGGQISNAQDLLLRTLGTPDSVVVHIVNLEALQSPQGLAIPGINGLLQTGPGFVVLPGFFTVSPVFGVANLPAPIDLNGIQFPDNTPVDLIFQSLSVDSNTFSLTPIVNKIRVLAQ